MRFSKLLVSFIAVNIAMVNSLNLDRSITRAVLNITSWTPQPASVCSQAVSIASNYASCGCPYVWGGNSCGCGGSGGLDCSGLTSQAYIQAGWSGIQRTAQDQFDQGTPCDGGSSGSSGSSSGSGGSSGSGSSTSNSGSGSSTSSNSGSGSTSSNSGSGSSTSSNSGSGSTSSNSGSGSSTSSNSGSGSAAASSSGSGSGSGSSSSTSSGSGSSSGSNNSNSSQQSGSGSSGTQMELGSSASGCGPGNTGPCTPGTLFFYTFPGESGIGHVVMYIGNGNIAECPQPGEDCHIIPAYTEYYQGCRTYC